MWGSSGCASELSWRLLKRIKCLTGGPDWDTGLCLLAMCKWNLPGACRAATRNMDIEWPIPGHRSIPTTHAFNWQRLQRCVLQGFSPHRQQLRTCRLGPGDTDRPRTSKSPNHFQIKLPFVIRPYHYYYNGGRRLPGWAPQPNLKPFNYGVAHLTKSQMEISEIPFHGHDGLWANLAEEDGDVFAVLSYQLTMSAKKAFRREH